MKSGRPAWYLTYYVWYLTKGSYVWSWPNNGGLYSDKELAKRHVLLPHKRTMSYRNFCLVLWCQQLSCCCYILSLSIAQTEIRRKRMFCCVQVSRETRLTIDVDSFIPGQKLSGYTRPVKKYTSHEIQGKVHGSFLLAELNCPRLGGNSVRCEQHVVEQSQTII